MTKNVNVILHTCALPPLSPYVLHYGPMDASKNGEPVFKFRYGLPGEDWREPEPNDPLSVVDQVGTKLVKLVPTLSTQVELALAYGCAESLSTELLIDYVHSNRMNNALRLGTLGSKIISIQFKTNNKWSIQVKLVASFNKFLHLLTKNINFFVTFL